jgi:pimeloyl-ACP methyl ester carboxylesterase
MRAGVQEVAYYQAGPDDGDPVLLHGFPYDIHSYKGVIPRLADRHERGFLVEHVMELLGDELALIGSPW